MDTQKSPYNIWFIITITAFIPFLLFIFIFVKWYLDKSDYKTKLNLFILRQNEVMIQDARYISNVVSELLENSVKDIKTLSLIPHSFDAYKNFYFFHMRKAKIPNSQTGNSEEKELPLYKEIIFINNEGNETIKLIDGKSVKNLLTLDQCLTKNLCDKESRKLAISLKPKKILFGNLMRYYSPKNSKDFYFGKYTLYYRVDSGVYELSLDYRHFISVLFLPSFPYYPKNDLLFAYENGNYIYMLDVKHEMISHPKYWHVFGIDRNSGEIVAPMINDEDEGKKRLSVSLYRGEKLKKYFYHLLTKSFLKPEIDIFKASNLRGKNHVYTVAPIVITVGQSYEKVPFGHIVIGCSLEYFEEPIKSIPSYY